MTLKITAAVARRPHGEFALEELELGSPGPHEILVKNVAAGICHTDVIVRDQWFPVPQPIVLGHEGSGIVVEVGSEVTRVATGDPVVMSMLGCGACVYCRTGPPGYCVSHYDLNFGGTRPDGTSALSKDDELVHGHFFNQSSFATHSIATEYNVVKIRDDVPLEMMGPLACGIQTGAGAVINSLQARPGTSIAVFGTGAVGMSAIMAARVAGCTTIIGVDVVADRLEMARALGATHVIDATAADAVAEIQSLTASGVNYSLDTTAVPAVARQAVESLALMGTCGLIGVPPTGTELTLDFHTVLFGRFVRGIVGGDAIAQHFIPTLIELWEQGRFPFDQMLRFYDLSEINDAVADGESGATVKPVLRMPV